MLRFTPTKRNWFTFGLAIDLLVGGVIGASSAGLVALALATGVAAATAWRLQALRSSHWLKAKEASSGSASGRAQ